MARCKWCSEGSPEWSYDALVWIHRRDRLDRRCENPQNSYGYTTQAPEITKREQDHIDDRLIRDGYTLDEIKGAFAAQAKDNARFTVDSIRNILRLTADRKKELR